MLQALAELSSSTVCILLTSIYRLCIDYSSSSSGGGDGDVSSTMVALDGTSSSAAAAAASSLDIMPTIVDAESVWNAILQSPSIVSVYKQYCAYNQKHHHHHHHHRSDDRRMGMMQLVGSSSSSSTVSWVKCADSLLRAYRSDPSLQRRLFQVGCSQSRPGISSRWEEKLHHWSSVQ